MFSLNPFAGSEVAISRAKLAVSNMISKGVDRDRAVDESGNQLAVFGRRGRGQTSQSEESERLYMRNGNAFRVSNEPRVPAH